MTKDEEAKVESLYTLYTSRGLATDRINKPLFETATKELYTLVAKDVNVADLQFRYFPSPLACEIYINLLENAEKKSTSTLQALIKEVEANPLFLLDPAIMKRIRSYRNHYPFTMHDMCYGQFDYYWFARYLVAESIGVTFDPETTKILHLWKDISESVSFWWPFDSIVIASEKPTKISLDPKGQLHADLAPAIAFRDGYSIFYLEGAAVPQELVMTKAEDLKPSDFKKYKNAEVRARFVKKLGIERLKDLGKVVDETEDGVYQLIDMSPVFSNLTYAPYLLMKNPSTDEHHFEGVESSCTTVKEALNWRVYEDTKIDWIPVELT